MSAGAQPRLERSLNLRNLVLFNLVAVIGITWVAIGLVFYWRCEEDKLSGSSGLAFPAKRRDVTRLSFAETSH